MLEIRRHEYNMCIHLRVFVEIFVQIEVFWVLIPCILLLYTNNLEKHAISIFRVEVCKLSSWLGYCKVARKWSLIPPSGNGREGNDSYEEHTMFFITGGIWNCEKVFIHFLLVNSVSTPNTLVLYAI